jgi:hypothetical protein
MTSEHKRIVRERVTAWLNQCTSGDRVPIAMICTHNVTKKVHVMGLDCLTWADLQELFRQLSEDEATSRRMT